MAEFEIGPAVFCAATLAAFAVGIAKTGLPGAGILAAPLMAAALPGRQAVAVILPLLVFGDLFAMACYWRDAKWKEVLILLPALLAGLAVGLWALTKLDNASLTRWLGGLVFLFLSLELLRTVVRLETRPWIGVPAGVLAGVATAIAHAAGPFVSIYLASLRIPTRQFLGNLAWLFFVINWLKVPSFFMNGMITSNTLALSLNVAAFVVFGAYVGVRLARTLKQRQFNALIYLFATAAGVWLLVK